MNRGIEQKYASHCVQDKVLASLLQLLSSGFRVPQTLIWNEHLQVRPSGGEKR